MKLVIKASSLMVLALLTGCAGMSKNDCLTKDWHQAGYNDGSNGSYRSSLTKEAKACARHKLPIDATAYGKGWEAGTRAFCTPSRAMNLGVNGQTYNPVCPSDQAGAFEKSWRQGLRRYCTAETGYRVGRNGGQLPQFCAADLAAAFNSAWHRGHAKHVLISSIQSELNNINDNISNKNKEIKDTQAKIDRWMHKLQDPAVLADPVAIESLRVKVKENNRSMRHMHTNISLLEIQRATVQAKLSRAETEG